jgi:hypothetical protein
MGGWDGVNALQGVREKLKTCEQITHKWSSAKYGKAGKSSKRRPRSLAALQRKKNRVKAEIKQLQGELIIC